MTSFTCCKKNPFGNKTTGKYLFCKIDGVDFILSTEANIGASSLKATLTNSNILTISADDDDNKSIGITVYDNTSIQNIKYALSNIPN